MQFPFLFYPFCATFFHSNFINSPKPIIAALVDLRRKVGQISILGEILIHLIDTTRNMAGRLDYRAPLADRAHAIPRSQAILRSPKKI